jgi:hypothetical protein
LSFTSTSTKYYCLYGFGGLPLDGTYNVQSRGNSSPIETEFGGDRPDFGRHVKCEVFGAKLGIKEVFLGAS